MQERSEYQDLAATLACLVHRDFVASPVPMERKAMLVLRDSEEHPVSEACLACLVIKVTRDFPASPARLAKRGREARSAILAQWAQKGSLVIQDLEVYWGHEDHRDLQEIQEHPVQREPKAPREIWDQLGHRGRLVQQETMDSRASLGRKETSVYQVHRVQPASLVLRDSLELMGCRVCPVRKVMVVRKEREARPAPSDILDFLDQRVLKVRMATEVHQETKANRGLLV